MLISIVQLTNKGYDASTDSIWRDVFFVCEQTAACPFEPSLSARPSEDKPAFFPWLVDLHIESSF